MSVTLNIQVGGGVQLQATTSTPALDLNVGLASSAVNEATLLALIQTLDGYDAAVPKGLIVEDGQLKLVPVQINEL